MTLGAVFTVGGVVFGCGAEEAAGGALEASVALAAGVAIGAVIVVGELDAATGVIAAPVGALCELSTTKTITPANKAVENDATSATTSVRLLVLPDPERVLQPGSVAFDRGCLPLCSLGVGVGAASVRADASSCCSGLDAPVMRGRDIEGGGTIIAPLKRTDPLPKGAIAAASDCTSW